MNTHPIVRIDGRTLVDRNNFHEAFAEAFGFPAFYGKNMDAWIDCMTSLDEPTHGMTSVHAPPGGVVVLQIDNYKYVRNRRPDLLSDIVECSAFVNWRRLEQGRPAVIALSYYDEA
jgi:hypothetical protein